MKTYTCTVIIPNYNGRELLEKNLPAVIDAWNYKPNNIKEVIVVDDASTDESVDFITRNYPQITLIKQRRNRGFSVTVNTGVRYAKGDLLVSINSDVTPAKNFLEHALPHFDDEKVFGVSLHEEGYGPSIPSFNNGYFDNSSGKESDVVEMTYWVSGGSGVFRKSIWKKLKGLDEDLFSPFYWEDVDICYRALKRGYRLLWEPKSKVNHKHESTTSKLNKKYKIRIQERNYLFFVWKNITSKRLFSKHKRAVIKRVLLHPGYMRIVLMAFAKWKTIKKKRKIEIENSKISDESVMALFK